MFDRVLVANRGEIAVRILRTLHRLDITGISVYSDADAHARHVRMADVAVRLGPASPRESYLDMERVLGAAEATGAQAIHPGYGFLSENAAFARACRDAGLIFIGPSPEIIALMGDKIAAKRRAVESGVPIVAGCHDDDMDDEALVAAMGALGLPALLKPAAGGGGKGMRIVRAGDDLLALIASARREARAGFGDDRLLVERYVDSPRHIEVQVIGDHHGAVVHMGERECTLQRRYQKVIEEAPSALLDEATRQELCAAAVRLARDVGYVNAGTVEFVVPSERPSDFAFLEMNTRLQVEHPLTEAVTGLDLVELQLRVAAGEPLGLSQADISFSGHAMEARVYAEDPLRGYLPTGGQILQWTEPQGVRVDSGVGAGDVVLSHYDPMLAKVIAHASTRIEVIEDLHAALREMVVFGVVTNIDDLADLLEDPRVRTGDIDTGLLADHVPRQIPPTPPALAAAAPTLLPAARDTLWAGGDAWRLGGPAAQRWHVADRDLQIRVDDVTSAVAGDGAPGITVRVDDEAVSASIIEAAAYTGEHLWIHADGRHHVATPQRIRDRRMRAIVGGHAAGRWSARSPMPGAIIEVCVHEGDAVAAGDPLVIVEAMKMEHTVRAPGPGVVVSITAAAGDRVPTDAPLMDMHLEGTT